MPRSLPARLALLLLAAGLVVSAMPAGPIDRTTKGLLDTLTKVGPEGAGSEEAARAWQQLVALGPPALIDTLAAMKDDAPRVANYLRTAVDAIAEKARADGKPLPKGPLEAFVRKTANARMARRQAFEWLARIDPTAKDRLLPDLLLDPSPELRREAVARVLAEAEKVKGDEGAARAAYRKALTGASDKDQMDQIVAALSKLGVKVDSAAHLGFVRRWLLAAPFDNTAGNGFDKAYPPEKEKTLDVKARYLGKKGAVVTWVPHRTTHPYGLVDLNKALGQHKGAIAYAAALLDSPAARAVEVRAGCITGLKIYLNGKLLFAREEYHHGMEMDQYVGRGVLQAGRNLLLIKVGQNEQTEDWAQNWQLQVRVCAPTGVAVPFDNVTPEAK